MPQSDMGTTDHIRLAKAALSRTYGQTKDVAYLKACDALIEAVEILQQYPEHPLRTMLMEKLGVNSGGWT